MRYISRIRTAEDVQIRTSVTPSATVSIIPVDINRTPRSREYSNHMKQLWFANSKINKVKQVCTLYTGNFIGSVPERTQPTLVLFCGKTWFQICVYVQSQNIRFCLLNYKVSSIAIHSTPTQQPNTLRLFRYFSTICFGCSFDHHQVEDKNS
jgi:hypothetical protein